MSMKYWKQAKQIAFVVLAVILVVGSFILHSIGESKLDREAEGSSAHVTPVEKVPVFTREKLLDLVNTNRKHALALDPTLNNTAQKKCDDMVAKDSWEHGDNWRDYLPADRSPVGENMAYGFASAQGLVDGWEKSPTHYTVMTNDDYSRTGFGICRFHEWVGVVEHFSN
jgi:hypothetical protein